MVHYTTLRAYVPWHTTYPGRPGKQHRPRSSPEKKDRMGVTIRVAGPGDEAVVARLVREMAEEDGE